MRIHPQDHQCSSRQYIHWPECILLIVRSHYHLPSTLIPSFIQTKSIFHIEKPVIIQRQLNIYMRILYSWIFDNSTQNETKTSWIKCMLWMNPGTGWCDACAIRCFILHHLICDFRKISFISSSSCMFDIQFEVHSKCCRRGSPQQRRRWIRVCVVAVASNVYKWSTAQQTSAEA